jgi:hypothetical protein
MQVKAAIEKKLTAALAPLRLSVIDDFAAPCRPCRGAARGRDPFQRRDRRRALRRVGVSPSDGFDGDAARETVLRVRAPRQRGALSLLGAA